MIYKTKTLKSYKSDSLDAMVNEFLSKEVAKLIDIKYQIVNTQNPNYTEHYAHIIYQESATI